LAPHVATEHAGRHWGRAVISPSVTAAEVAGPFVVLIVTSLLLVVVGGLIMVGTMVGTVVGTVVADGEVLGASGGCDVGGTIL